MFKIIFPLMLCFLFPLCALERQEKFVEIPETPTLTIVPVPATPEPNNVSLDIAFPEEGQIVGEPVVLNFRLTGYSLGTRSYFPRGEEILDQGIGQAIHIVIDDEPYLTYAGSGIDPYDQDGDYYEQNYQITLPIDFSEGEHTIRAFPARSYGESLKSPDCFGMVSFYVGNRSHSQKIVDPILTYNEPSPKQTYRENTPILLDFLVTNGLLAKGSYGVKVRIDGKTIHTLYEETPYYIYGLAKGRHTLSITLVDNRGKEMGGIYQQSSVVIRVS
ncbi:MAG: hypothetical protein AAGI90_02170 [Chlamydiota bacterium]